MLHHNLVNSSLFGAEGGGAGRLKCGLLCRDATGGGGALR